MDQQLPNGSNHTGDGKLGRDFHPPTQHRRGHSLISKIKALATSGSPSLSTKTSDAVDDAQESTPSVAATTPWLGISGFSHNTPHEDSDADADAEETADEELARASLTVRRKRRSRRPRFTPSGSQTQPNTPQASSTIIPMHGDGSHPAITLNRQGTDGSLEGRGHLSEGEGRDRLSSQSAWRRGSSWLAGARGLNGEGDPASPLRRPSTFTKRLTGLGGQSEGEGTASRKQLFSTDRATTFGTQRWRMLKQGLKLLAQKKDEYKGDYLKSAELMAELRAGAPAALMLASMMQRDDNGNKRIPVLLEQIKLRITDSRPDDDESSDQETGVHTRYRIELEYGSGYNRMKWVVSRTFFDFTKLHSAYIFAGRLGKEKGKTEHSSKSKRPNFPKTAFPKASRWIQWAESDNEDEEEQVADAAAENAAVAEALPTESDRKLAKKRRPSYAGNRRQSSGGLLDGSKAAEEQRIRLANQKGRLRLEQYLQQMIRWLILRPDSNRLCRFLELSALGVRLAAEGSYHGKEGFLNIVSAKGLDFRRYLTPKNVLDRHSAKWFLVRHSYVVCVESPENMHIYDVYMVDSQFKIAGKRRKFREMDPKEIVGTMETSAKHPTHFNFRIVNSERRVKFLARNERHLKQFEDSISFMLKNTPWSQVHRFDSFAPVRTNAFAQWLVDGRDYMWNVSRAINMAKDVIYLHDWWISPQLYMRRPAAISQKWRLDRLLQKKAREGVKVFIIMYRNVEAAIPIDSEYTKFSMLDLHPNIFVQRSPNQFKKNQFLYAHHEKICIVDHTVAFVGGIDLCFGRWDTPQHSVTDDKPTGFEQSDVPKDADHCQLWPGKDYSNPRVQDFYKLSEPYAEMYDRTKTPRMPWHDVSMQVVGQPARDLTRHFVQRWNYVLRGRKPTRPTPFLLPPPDYVAADLEALGLTGTCEVQILRSAGDWSLGLTSTEHSIMTAYCKMIEESDHFVYIENQFFITSCETMNTKIVNKIGDAIVERAVRAYRSNQAWHCIVMLPLMPGFQNTVDEQEGSSVRLIMQCQFRSICRGETSIFVRLRSEGIEPEEFVSFYSLRSWGKIGPSKMLVTEQLYIHAKVIVVDDRIALIGSANINERSMLGMRDSECAAVVRDTDMIWSTMAGQPYLVGRFAHTLRMRLMREHLGIDVDAIMEEERLADLSKEEDDIKAKMDRIFDDLDDDEDIREDQVMHSEPERTARSRQSERRSLLRNQISFNHDVDWEQDQNPNLMTQRYKPVTTDKRVIGNAEHAAEVDGQGADRWAAAEKSGVSRGRDSVTVEDGREILVSDIAAEGKGTITRPSRSRSRWVPPPRQRRNSDAGEASVEIYPPQPPLIRKTTEEIGLSQLSQLPALPVVDDTDIGGPPVQLDTHGHPTHKSFNPLTADIKPVVVDRDCMRDPLNDTFFDDTWRMIAENNTKIFRRVFRCNPDSEVTNWHEYTEFVAYNERFAQAQGAGKGVERAAQEATGKSGPPGSQTTSVPTAIVEGIHNVAEKLKHDGPAQPHQSLGTVSEWAENARVEHDQRVKTATDAEFTGNDEKAAMATDTEPSTRTTANEPFPALDPATEKPYPTQSQARRTTFSTSIPSEKLAPTSTNSTVAPGSVRRKRRNTTKTSKKGFSASDDLINIADAEELLGMVQGHIVQFPYDWLAKEEANSNWLYQVDQVAPLAI